jgi:sec-independent protein translocase protein TatA
MGHLKEPLMPFGMGFGELVLVLIIVVVVFGATKLPQLGDGLGKAIKNFKRAVNSQDEIDVSPGAKKSELDEEAGKAGKSGSSSKVV